MYPTSLQNKFPIGSQLVVMSQIVIACVNSIFGKHSETSSHQKEQGEKTNFLVQEGFKIWFGDLKWIFIP